MGGLQAPRTAEEMERLQLDVLARLEAGNRRSSGCGSRREACGRLSPSSWTQERVASATDWSSVARWFGKLGVPDGCRVRQDVDCGCRQVQCAASGRNATRMGERRAVPPPVLAPCSRGRTSTKSCGCRKGFGSTGCRNHRRISRRPCPSVGMVTEDDLLGGVVMSIDCEMSPALYHPDEDKAHDPWFVRRGVQTGTGAGPEPVARQLLRVGFAGLQRLCRLVPGVEGLRGAGGVQRHAIGWTLQCSVRTPQNEDRKVSQAALEEALNIHRARYGGGKPRENMELAISRWVQVEAGGDGRGPAHRHPDRTGGALTKSATKTRKGFASRPTGRGIWGKIPSGGVKFKKRCARPTAPPRAPCTPISSNLRRRTRL